MSGFSITRYPVKYTMRTRHIKTTDCGNICKNNRGIVSFNGYLLDPDWDITYKKYRYLFGNTFGVDNVFLDEEIMQTLIVYISGFLI
jgi:hypothetical protein